MHEDDVEGATPADDPDLRAQVRVLEDEVASLLRRLQDAPKRVRTLEERLLETKGQLAQAVSQNEKLTATLREARDHIAALREEVGKLTQPPAAYATFLGRNDDGTVDVQAAGRKMRVQVSPEVDLDDPSVSDAMRRFYRDSKRLSNAKAKAELGWRPKYPTWREGLESLIAHDAT